MRSSAVASVNAEGGGSEDAIIAVDAQADDEKEAEEKSLDLPPNPVPDFPREDAWLTVQAGKNKKQKSWAFKMLLKLMTDVCKRRVHGKPPARLRRARAFWECGGWENIAGICYEPCHGDETGH